MRGLIGAVVLVLLAGCGGDDKAARAAEDRHVADVMAHNAKVDRRHEREVRRYMRDTFGQQPDSTRPVWYDSITGYKANGFQLTVKTSMYPDEGSKVYAEPICGVITSAQLAWADQVFIDGQDGALVMTC